MSRSIFGWSYPPGCSGPPEDVETVVLRCKHCKAFIGGIPKDEPWESSSECKGHTPAEGMECMADPECLCGDFKPHGPHKVVWDAGVNFIYTCKKCGKETKA